MKVFVTGARRRGAAAVEALVQAGHEVSGVARSPEIRAAAVTGASPVEVDLFDGEAVTEAVRGSEVVANLATKIPPTSKAAIKRSWAENERIPGGGRQTLPMPSSPPTPARLVQESIAFAYVEGERDEWLDESAPLDLPEGFQAPA